MSPAKTDVTRKDMDPVRCRFCAEGENFLPLVPHTDGRFTCGSCGHVEIPNVEFECNCGNCAELSWFELSRTIKPSLVGSSGYLSLLGPVRDLQTSDSHSCASVTFGYQFLTSIRRDRRMKWYRLDGLQATHNSTGNCPQHTHSSHRQVPPLVSSN